METFDLESHLQDAYSRFPEAKHQPVIGLTANYEGIDATLRDRYYKQVIAAGGTPVIIPPVADAQVIVNTLEHLDGLILTGGGDHNPLWMGEEPSPRLHNINQERDAAELMIARLAFRQCMTPESRSSASAGASRPSLLRWAERCARISSSW